MAYSNSTTNYHLPLPTDSDKSNWTDANTGFTAIDTAVKSNADAIVALAARVTALENAPGVDMTDFIKYDNEAQTSGLTNNEYKKLIRVNTNS